MKILDEKDPTLTPFEKSCVYNAQDVSNTLALYHVLYPQQSASNKIMYHLWRALQAPVMAMGIRGFRVDEAEVQRFYPVLSADQEQYKNEAKEIIKTYIDEYWAETFNLGSEDQLKKVLYGEQNQPPCPRCNNTLREHIGFYKTGPKAGQPKSRKCQANIHEYTGFGCRPYIDHKTKETTVGAKQLVKFVQREPEGSPQRQLAEIRLNFAAVTKQMQELDFIRGPSGRFHFETRVDGTKSGRFSSNKNQFGEGCLPGDAEVLTKQGWKPLDQCDEWEIIAQGNPKTDEITFLPAKLYKEEAWERTLIQCESEQFYFFGTQGHRLFAKHPGRKYSGEATALDLSLCKSARELPVAGRLTNTNAIVPYARLWAAYIADGHHQGGQCRWSFKKERKSQRLQELAEIYDVNLREMKARPGCRKFVMDWPEQWPQDWGPWLLNQNVLSLEAIVDESRWWDGSRRSNGNQSFMFHTAKKYRAEWMQTIAVLTGCGATVKEQKQPVNSWSTTLMYRVNIKPRAHVIVQPQHWKQSIETIPVFCFHTQTGFFLVKQNGKIHVTGNSNGQNYDKRLRSIIIPDDDYTFFRRDYRRAESHVLAYLAQDEMYIEAHEGVYDTHTLVARMVWENELPWTGDPKADQKLADGTQFPLTKAKKSYRDIGKVVQHGLTRGATKVMLAREVGCSLAVGQSIIDGFFEKFSGVYNYMETFWENLKHDPILKIQCGEDVYEHQVIGRHWDPKEGREAISVVLQFYVALLTHMSMHRIWTQLDEKDLTPGVGPLQLLNHEHDALLYQIKTGYEHLDNDVARLMTIPLTINNRVLTVPTDGKHGKNWKEVC